MGRLSHLGSKRNSDVLLVVQDGAPAWKTSPASGVMLSVRYQAHCSASQLCLSEIKHAHTNDGVRQEMVPAKCDHVLIQGDDILGRRRERRSAP
jgi:hypothetical protein